MTERPGALSVTQEGAPNSSPTPEGSDRLGRSQRVQGFRLKAVLSNSATQTTRWYADPGDVQRWAVHRGMTLDPVPGTDPALPWMVATDLDVEELDGGKLRHRPASVEDVEQWASGRGLRLLLDAG